MNMRPFYPTIFFALAAALGLLILLPSVDIHGYLSTGDHGRDYYAFERSLNGETAFHDYWWVYGPLMPFYYALFVKFLGANMLSALVGKMLLKLAAGLFVFLTLNTLFSAAAAILGAVWFWLFFQDFFFTHNHTGGIVCVCAIAHCLIAYIKNKNFRFIWGALAAAFLLALIKVNFGIMGLLITAGTLFLTDRIDKTPTDRERKLFYLGTCCVFPLLVLGVYAYLLRGMPLYEIRQCLPYSNADQPYNTMPWVALAFFWNNFLANFFSSWMNFVFGALFMASAVRIITLFITRKLPDATVRLYGLALVVLGAYFILNFHEYLKSGVWYRSVWAQPLSLLFMFTTMAIAAESLQVWLRRSLWIIVAGLALYAGILQFSHLKDLHAPSRYIHHPKAKVFVTNDPGWIQTVSATAAFLEKTLKPGEDFFALPYDPMYYYLTGRQSPVQLLIFFEHINIPKVQEEKIIAALEAKKINYILLSNRYASREAGLGILGTTYCPLIGKYIQEHFVPVAQFGDWQHEPGWGWAHGTVILKRKSL